MPHDRSDDELEALARDKWCAENPDQANSFRSASIIDGTRPKPGTSHAIRQVQISGEEGRLLAVYAETTDDAEPLVVVS